ncbi:MAG TPA: hypothetical protein VKT77_09965, partial [Chthonomonadaceae bacterium]|nr:hypothetical protein [Chthonomonadaceae bacterium]
MNHRHLAAPIPAIVGALMAGSGAAAVGAAAPTWQTTSRERNFAGDRSTYGIAAVSLHAELHGASRPEPQSTSNKPQATNQTPQIPPKPAAHEARTMEGWTVHVDRRLLGGPDRALGDRALRILAMRLFAITLVVPADKVKWLQTVPIWLDRTHGALKSMQYHPSVEWLRQNGYDSRLARCVHIPDAAYFASFEIQFQQPWAVLHELAHAYHDQVLGFDNAEVLAAWRKFVASGKYASVPHMNGRMRPHY